MPTCVYLFYGAFHNYVDRILPFLTPSPSSCPHSYSQVSIKRASLFNRDLSVLNGPKVVWLIELVHCLLDWRYKIIFILKINASPGDGWIALFRRPWNAFLERENREILFTFKEKIFFSFHIVTYSFRSHTFHCI